MGDNTYGETGLGKTTSSNTVNTIKFLEGKDVIKKIAVGARHSLVLLDNGEIYSFGDNSDYQCSNLSDRYSKPKQVNIEINDKVVDIFAGYTHSMAVTSKFDIYAWGDSSYGKLGLNEGGSSLAYPKQLGKLKGKIPSSISLGYQVSAISTSKRANSILNIRSDF